MRVIIFYDSIRNEIWTTEVPDDSLPFFVRPEYHPREKDAEDDEDEPTH